MKRKIGAIVSVLALATVLLTGVPSTAEAHPAGDCGGVNHGAWSDVSLWYGQYWQRHNGTSYNYGCQVQAGMEGSQWSVDGPWMAAPNISRTPWNLQSDVIGVSVAKRHVSH